MTRFVPPVDLDGADDGRPDVDRLVRLEIAEDGAEARVTLFDAAERRAVLALPIGRLADLMAALPQHQAPEIPTQALIVRAWRLSSRGPDGARVTFETPGGRAAQFYATPDGIMALALSPSQDA